VIYPDLRWEADLDVDELRARLARMSDRALLEFGRAAACSQGAAAWTSRGGKNYPMHFPLPFSICRILAFSPSQTKMQPGNSGQGGPPVVLPKRQLQVLLLMCDGPYW